MNLEYETGQINSRILGRFLRRFCRLIFAPSQKILICFSLIKRFPNSHKRCFSHLQVSILYRVALTKVYLTIYEGLRNSY